jgi:ribosomal protein S4
VAKNLAKTPRGARQLITHKKVLVNGNAVNSPSYIVPVNFEDKITLKIKNKKQDKIAKTPEAKDEHE